MRIDSRLHESFGGACCGFVDLNHKTPAKPEIIWVIEVIELPIDQTPEIIGD
jgi:hypothetical protein